MADCGALRARLSLGRERRRPRGDPGGRDHPVDVRPLPRREAIQQNLTRARALQASAANQTITLEFPSDLTVNGVPFASMAQRVQANLQAAGFKVELAGAPVGTWLQKYRDGKMAFGLSLWGPDYPDPADYLAFMPGELVGTRAGWPAGSMRRSNGCRHGAHHDRGEAP